MTTAYARLYEAVERLASPPERQSSYLTEIFAEMDGQNARYRNCDELALELDDFFCEGKGAAASHLSEEQIALIGDLDTYLNDCSGKQNKEFWQREALFLDDRWQHVRSLATRALLRLPRPT
ncbi:MAG: hypothetical protein AAFQ13_03790 [Pseudomonadota bacterium]